MKNKLFKISLVILFLNCIQTKAVEPLVKVACVGNSITAGYLLQSSQAYPSVLQNVLGNNYEVKNFGVSGTTFLVNTGDEWSYWGSNGKLSQVDAYLPDIIIIELGTNDSKPQYNSYRANLQADIEAMITKFKAYSSNPEIYICLPLPAFKVNFDIQPLIVENTIIPAIQQAAISQNVPTINLFSLFKNNPELTSDGIHPTIYGSQIIANFVYSKISTINKITSFSLDTTDVFINKNDSLTLKPHILPLNATLSMAIWSSNNVNVATVKPNGTIKAITEGTCTIYAKAIDGFFTDSCTVTVVPALGKFEYKTSWLGNTFGGGTKWVQNFIDAIRVTPDGTVYTTSTWDEAGRKWGIYKNGDVIGNKNMGVNGKLTTDKNGVIWAIVNDTIKASNGKIITDVIKPTAIAINNQNKLMVTENGPRQQILIYNIQNNPSLESTFGEEGGLFSGIPGQCAPLKFHNLTGVGVDSLNNIYVSMSSGPVGCELHCYNQNGNLLWQLNGLLFIDVPDIDRNNKYGTDIYTKNARFTLDYSKPTGQQWQYKARTLNHIKYPNDARIKSWGNGGAYLHPGPAWIRYVNGKKIQVVPDMFSEHLRFYRFNPETDGEIAIPSAVFAKFNASPFLFNIIRFNIDNNNYKAANWNSQFGITNETDSVVANIQHGDYIMFNSIDFGSGATSFTTQTASPLNGGNIEIRIDSINGQLIGTCVTSTTGGWAAYKPASCSLSGNVSGEHKLFLIFKYFDNAWPPYQPERGEWIWTDTNGNGQMDNNEYQNYGQEAPKGSKTYWVDMKANIWQINQTGIRYFKNQGLDEVGNPKYDYSNIESFTSPLPFNSLKLIEYNTDKDELYLVGSVNNSGALHFARYKNWLVGNRTHDILIELPNVELAAFCVEDNYLFVAEVFSGIIHIFSLQTLNKVGIISPAAEVFNETGWIDIPYGIRAYKRPDGEFIIFAEEDAKGKVIIYRWRPCLPHSHASVNIVTPQNNQVFQISGIKGSIPIKAIASSPSGFIKKIEFYVNGKFKNTVRAEPFEFTLNNATIGTHTVYAISTDYLDSTITSNEITFTIEKSPVNIDNNTINSFEIFPNPAIDYLHLSSNTQKEELACINICNVHGQQVFTQNVILKANETTLYTFNIKHLKNGIYFVKIISNNLNYTKKVIVN